MHRNIPVPRFKLSSFSHFVTTASSYPKPEPTALRGRRQKRQRYSSVANLPPNGLPDPMYKIDLPVFTGTIKVPVRWVNQNGGLTTGPCRPIHYAEWSE